MKSVLVLGGTGMLGSMVTDELSRSPELRLSATYRSADRAPNPARLPGVHWNPFDASAGRLQEQLAACGENAWIINAIGITKPLIREDDPRQIETAIRVNALLPHSIAAFARAVGARVLQIATDCVYSGAQAYMWKRIYTTRSMFTEKPRAWESVKSQTCIICGVRSSVRSRRTSNS